MIVDDEVIAQRIIAGYLADLEDFEVVARCTNAITAMEELKKQEVDLLFLDIEMPKLSGLSLLKTLHNPPPVILTTAHREYALEGFELQVVDYLLKPISFERFLKSLNLFKMRRPKLGGIESEEATDLGPIIYVKSDKKNYKLNVNSISYIESMSNYIIIHLAKDRYIVYKSLADILEELPKSFIRIHKSYVVNKDKIDYFTRELVKVGAKEVPIGKTYKENIALL